MTGETIDPNEDFEGTVPTRENRHGGLLDPWEGGAISSKGPTPENSDFGGYSKGDPGDQYVDARLTHFAQRIEESRGEPEEPNA